MNLAIIFGLEAASQGQTNRKGMGPGGLKLYVSSAPQCLCMKNGCIIYRHFRIVEGLCE